MACTRGLRAVRRVRQAEEEERDSAKAAAVVAIRRCLSALISSAAPVPARAACNVPRFSRRSPPAEAVNPFPTARVCVLLAAGAALARSEVFLLSKVAAGPCDLRAKRNRLRSGRAILGHGAGSLLLSRAI